MPFYMVPYLYRHRLFLNASLINAASAVWTFFKDFLIFNNKIKLKTMYFCFYIENENSKMIPTLRCNIPDRVLCYSDCKALKFSPH